MQSITNGTVSLRITIGLPLYENTNKRSHVERAQKSTLKKTEMRLLALKSIANALYRCTLVDWSQCQALPANACFRPSPLAVKYLNVISLSDQRVQHLDEDVILSLECGSLVPPGQD